MTLLRFSTVSLALTCCFTPPLLAQNLTGNDLTLSGEITQNGVGTNFFNGNTSVFNGRACIGPTCDGTEPFEQGPLRLKWSEPDILFEDSSSTAGISSNDWRLVVNSVGQTRFSVEDIDGGSIPFTIAGGVPENAFWLASTGDVGFGTSIPQNRLHIVGSDSPGIMLQQTGGLGAQRWEMSGNETAFFIRDTDSNTLPFAIDVDAPTDALVINDTGNVGLGTEVAKATLHVRGSGNEFNADASTMALFQNNGVPSGITRFTLLSGNTGNGQIAFGDTDSEFSGRIRYFHEDDHMDFLVNRSVEALRVFDGSGPNTLETATSTAVLTSAGVWQNASSRTLKQNIKSLDLSAAKAALTELEPVTYQYKKEPDELVAGFVAEDVPEIVATSSRKTLSALDITAVLTRVVQDQQETIEGQQAMIAGLTTRIEALEQ